MYKLRKGEHIAITDSESKRDQFMRLGFELVKEPEKPAEKAEKGKNEDSRERKSRRQTLRDRLHK